MRSDVSLETRCNDQRLGGEGSEGGRVRAVGTVR